MSCYPTAWVPLRCASGAAQVAPRDTGASIVAGSNRVLTFGGISQPVVPPGALMISDPVNLAVKDSGDLAIDLHLPDDTSVWKSPVTVHPASWQVNNVSSQGNYVGATRFPVMATTAYRRRDGLASASSFFLARVEVVAAPPTGVLVAFGDSIYRRHAVWNRCESPLTRSAKYSSSHGRHQAKRGEWRDRRRPRAGGRRRTECASPL